MMVESQVVVRRTKVVLSTCERHVRMEVYEIRNSHDEGDNYGEHCS